MKGMMTAIMGMTARVTMIEAGTQRERDARAFTLLEMMVALMVLVLMVVLTAQITGNTSKVTSGITRQLDADAEARGVFDRMGADFSQMVIRPDVDTLFLGLPLGFVGADHNDQLYFYSQVPAYSTNVAQQSPLALIAYRVRNQRLERLGASRSWDEILFLTPSNSLTGFDPNALLQNLGDVTNHFQVIAPSVFRMEAAFLMKPGTTNGDGSVNTINSYAKMNDAVNPRHGFANVAAIVVALGVLDQTSRAAASGPELDSLASLLPDASTNGGIPLAAWSSNAFSASDIPLAVRSHVRFYIRHFPLKR